ncbi:MAG: hypothetical protein PF637_01625 [Spirochaetes bacterium]|jgi:hypothetical protein|nr:hypothetical protein [Spirochaetota bacterium]
MNKPDVISRYESIITIKEKEGQLTDSDIAFLLNSFIMGDLDIDYSRRFCAAVSQHGLTNNEKNFIAEFVSESCYKYPASLLCDLVISSAGDDPSVVKFFLVLASVLACFQIRSCLLNRQLAGGNSGGALLSVPGFSFPETLDECCSIMEVSSICVVNHGSLIPSVSDLFEPLISMASAEGAHPLLSALRYGELRSFNRKTISIFLDDTLSVKSVDNCLFSEVLLQAGAESTVYTVTSPLGKNLGSVLSLFEIIDTLKAEQFGPLHTAVRSVAPQILLKFGHANSIEEADFLVEGAIDSRDALHSFENYAAACGADTQILSDPFCLPVADYVTEVTVRQSGHISGINYHLLHEAATLLFEEAESVMPHSGRGTGISMHVAEKDQVLVKEIYCTIYHSKKVLPIGLSSLIDESYRVEPVSI